MLWGGVGGDQISGSLNNFSNERFGGGGGGGAFLFK